MEPQINTLEVLEVLDKVDALYSKEESLESYLAPSGVIQACPQFSAGQRDLFSALIARHLEKEAQ